MTDISLAMIVKDEPLDRLAMLVEYVQPVVSQVVIADTGSANLETHIYNTWTNVKAFEHEWKNDFAESRNSTLEYIPEDNFVLVLDADELPSFEMMKHLLWLKDNAPSHILAYQFWTKNYFAGLLDPDQNYYWHCRLFRRSAGKMYKPVHEGVMLNDMPEHVSMQNGTMVHAPQEAYLIHAKPTERIALSDALYERMSVGG